MLLFNWIFFSQPVQVLKISCACITFKILSGKVKPVILKDDLEKKLVNYEINTTYIM